jgi:ATP-dependent DNA helicase RecQ
MDAAAEWAMLQAACFTERIESRIPGDLGFTIPLPSRVTDQAVHDALMAARPDVELRNDWDFDSPEEAQFLRLLHAEYGGEVARWVHPQPSIGALRQDPADSRRADFLVATPWQAPVVVEIDGIQHRRAVAVDAARDLDLSDCGIEVVRIPAASIRRGDLGELRRHLQPLRTMRRAGEKSNLLVHGPAQTTRLGLALAEAFDRGWLQGAGTWTLRIFDSLNIAPAVLPSLLELFASIDELWAGHLAPASVRVEIGGEALGFRRMEVARYEPAEAPEGTASVSIFLDHDLAPGDALPDVVGPAIVVRGAILPVSLSERRAEGSVLASLQDPAAMAPALQRVLRFVFAKHDFREGQLDALRQVMRRRDCLVLLPTGAGKSFIYQLAGLLLPGRTIIIDPIVALMEDQIEGLRRSGIDRAVGISSFVTQQGLTGQALAMVRSGDALFCFISPERLQDRQFREALFTLTVRAPINLAVVDEAHCISEWGHDFRPAYLNLGPVLRRLFRASDGSAPPILALTGTASRAVLRDVLVELDLDRSDAHAVVKPYSFGRPELTFEVVRANPGDARARLLGAVQALPARLRTPDLFTGPGRSHLGIVFCPHVNGDQGVVSVAEAIRESITARVGYYAGSAPRGSDEQSWDFEKRRIADEFRSGNLTVLCATNAFGMGVDIANVRFTVHFGIPGSIEAFYQEAGRAGRDRQPSYCTAVFTEIDSRLSEQLLSDGSDTEEARGLFVRRAQTARDDILNQLWFHFNTFRGLVVEQEAIRRLAADLQWDGTSREVRIPFARGESAEATQERAILRLQQVGMVRDYLKEWGSRAYSISLAEADIRDVRDAFLRFVARTQPGKLDERRGVADGLVHGGVANLATQLAEIASEMVYDSVEKARRRALREMRALAAHGMDSATIQRRIEDYFREGELAPQLEQLLEATRVELHEWFGVYRGLTRADVGELRGSTARLLESYPDHPGVLVGRSLAELMTAQGEGDAFEFRDNLTRAFSFGSERYSMNPEHLANLLRFMLEQAAEYREEWRPLVWLGWEAASTGEAAGEIERDALTSTATTPGEFVVILQRRLRRDQALAALLVKSTSGDK